MRISTFPQTETRDTTYVKKKIVPTTTDVTPNDPKSHVNRCSTFTAVSAKLSADARAVWNCEKAMTTDFMRFGAFVNAYSSEVMDACGSCSAGTPHPQRLEVRTKISDKPTRMYGPDTTHTLMSTKSGVLFSSRQADGWLSWQGEFL